jgi:hypothetical protein
LWGEGRVGRGGCCWGSWGVIDACWSNWEGGNWKATRGSRVLVVLLCLLLWWRWPGWFRVAGIIMASPNGIHGNGWLYVWLMLLCLLLPREGEGPQRMKVYGIE